MTIKDFFNNYTCAAGTRVVVMLPREAHNTTIVESLDTYGDKEIIAWRLSEREPKLITIEVN